MRPVRRPGSAWPLDEAAPDALVHWWCSPSTRLTSRAGWANRTPGARSTSVQYSSVSARGERVPSIAGLHVLLAHVRGRQAGLALYGYHDGVVAIARGGRGMSAIKHMPRVLAVDAGGTMTDVFIVDEHGSFVVGKAQSTPDD